MAARRSYGEGSLYWHEQRQRWVGLVSLGYWPNGKRRVKWISGRTKTEAKAKLREAQRAHDLGVISGPHAYTVRDAVDSWLEHGLAGRGAGLRVFLPEPGLTSADYCLGERSAASPRRFL